MKGSHCNYLFLALFLILLGSTQAQTCNSCHSSVSLNDNLTYSISKTDTLTYTLSAGQTLCIYSSGTFKGSVINNGGVICNSGRFFPKTFTFNSGSFINNKTFKIQASLSLSGSATLINNPESVLNIQGDLILAGGTINNEGLINVATNLQNNSGTFTNKGIINCSGSTGSNAMNNYNNIGLVNTKN